MHMQAPLAELFEKSKLMVLDFSQIPPNAPPAENIQAFFEACEAKGINPRLPENRQEFNNRMLGATHMRYLVSRYGEDRKSMLADSRIASEGRTLHMGIDIFCKKQEPVYAPCDGAIVRASHETDDHGYGYYVILQPAHIPGVYFFFGHLAHDLPALGPVAAGDRIATLGSYVNNENGGWSRHLHLQILSELSPEDQPPIGYSPVSDFAKNSRLFPSPMPYFPSWQLQ
jgi:murein DD-endopeptidase MepM/ murein hydrolase activator NlpD